MERVLHERILHIQGGNTGELLTIIDKFKPLIQKYKRKLNYEESETDLTIAIIEILFSIDLKNFETYGDCAIVTFICNSIRNRSIDLFRKYVLKKTHEIEFNFDIMGDSIKENIDDKLFIAELLDKLSKKQLFIIIEKYFKCQSDAEIANYLHISRQAVNKSKNKALNTLRDYITYYVVA
ncbi:sigma-70 family RNA polymerase sigma factor [Clostridium sp.]|uniref:sigma-70 family RNA polymerase sigma factor n=1 Tax=Clostridium sp. TaxID=1506 RepID=UPI003D6CBD54